VEFEPLVRSGSPTAPRGQESTMANMSYCRFENTLRDLQDVEFALEQYLVAPEEAPTSESEMAAMRELGPVCERVQELLAELAEMQEEIEEERRAEEHKALMRAARLRRAELLAELSALDSGLSDVDAERGAYGGSPDAPTS